MGVPSDNWHTETPMEEMLLTSCKWLTINCSSGDYNMGTKQDTPAASTLVLYWADIVSIFASKMFTKIFSKTCCSFYINYVADMDTWTDTENSLASIIPSSLKGSLVLFISSSKLCKAFLHINLTFKQTITHSFYLLWPNINTYNSASRTQGRCYIKSVTWAVFPAKLSSLAF